VNDKPWLRIPVATGDFTMHDPADDYVGPDVPFARTSALAFGGRHPRVEWREFGDLPTAPADDVDCDRCIAGKGGERLDVRTFDEEPCEHVAGDTI
jgi:hypothetical protein